MNSKNTTPDMNTETISTLYKQVTGQQHDNIELLTGSGSNRQYFRMTGIRNLIAVRGESIAENRAFIYMARHFHEKGIHVPEVLAVSDDESCYIQEDLGDTLLFNAIANGRNTGIFSNHEKELIRKSITVLPSIQFKGAEDMDFGMCYPLSDFNRRTVMWDLNYFKYCFLKATGINFNESNLEDDFEEMTDILLSASSDTFMYRDFQSRNVIIKDERPYFIDFQGGRKGPIYYDVASFLWQAKANFNSEIREEMIETYISEANKFTEINSEDFKKTLHNFVVFRTMQVLGAYGFRGLFERKTHFIESIPYALNNLQTLFKNNIKTMNTDKQLTVKVMSFSYRKGIPEDTSGNGGGYVFDCRYVHNPGRYDEYKPLTGLDKPVIDFLENDGEITEFLTHVYALTDAHVKRYLERGFTSLMICFGCTGGQHRSVYSAQHTAEHIHNKFGVRVELFHREQNIEQIFEANNTEV